MTADGTIFTLAGGGTAGFFGDGGPATSAWLHYPCGVGLDPSGNLYIADYLNHRVRMVAEATGVRPASPEDVDLYAGGRLPDGRATAGVPFDLGVRVRNRGPATVKGEQVSVTLTLSQGLVGDGGCIQHTCTRTFPGMELRPDVDSLDRTFKVHAPNTTEPGTYTATAAVTYAHETKPSDNTVELPVTIVKAEPEAQDESALTITQTVAAGAAPGKGTAIQLQLSASPTVRVNPGVITQTFKAPTGFVFTNAPIWAYPGGNTGHLDHTIENQGRTLVAKGNPHVNTATSDRSPPTYTLPMRAEATASPAPGPTAPPPSASTPPSPCPAPSPEPPSTR
ncbi:hypothetical protein ACFY4B_42170 [Kitasatospora sp. NPDC001261]|uniref:hypothetical protein n=1 Tax=Kitasatospora sp. NPDC001261 TaxID=3364012 RepID=UPI00368ACEEA